MKVGSRLYENTNFGESWFSMIVEEDGRSFLWSRMHSFIFKKMNTPKL